MGKQIRNIKLTSSEEEQLQYEVFYNAEWTYDSNVKQDPADGEYKDYRFMVKKGTVIDNQGDDPITDPTDPDYDPDLVPDPNIDPSDPDIVIDGNGDIIIEETTVNLFVVDSKEYEFGGHLASGFEGEVGDLIIIFSFYNK